MTISPTHNVFSFSRFVLTRRMIGSSVMSTLLLGWLMIASLPSAVADEQLVLTGANPSLVFTDDIAPIKTWQLVGSNLGFRLLDLPTISDVFHIESGNPLHTFFMTGGSVGFGTNTPNVTLNTSVPGRYLNLRAAGSTTADGIANGVFQGGLGAQNHLVHINGPVNQKIMRLQCSSGFFGFHVLTDNLAAKSVADAISIKMANGNIGLRVQNPTHPLQLASGAHCTAGGVFTNVSSRDAKEAIRPLTTDQARATVQALEPVGYRYKAEPAEEYLGFIAEDVPELVATNGRKSLAPLDITAVLTKVVQDQDRQLTEQQRINAEQKRHVADQNRQLGEQRALIESLTKRLMILEQKMGDH